MTQMLPANAVVAIRRPRSIVFPPRTLLYHLAPQASESIWCESLTGYINRLGWTHHVSPRALVAEVINPQLPKPTPFVAAFCLQSAMGLNGNGEQSSVWGEVIGQLTGRPELHRLTLATLLGDFPPIRILRRTPAWCPACLTEWKTTGLPLYQPLLWMLQLVTICPAHGMPLVDRCPTCHKSQKVLTTTKTRPFECTSCTIWLGGESSPFPKEEDTAQLITWQTWVISALEELRAVSLGIGALSWQPFFTNLSCYLKERRAYARIAAAIGTDRTNFHNWVTKQDVTLETLFKFCYNCEVTPWQVMSGQLEPFERVMQEGARRSSPLPQRPNHRLNREHCLRQLHEALNENAAPPSLRQVGRQLGYSSTALLMYHFPEECAVIIQRHGEYRNQRKEQRLLKLRADIRHAVFSLHAQGEYPLIYKLSDVFPNGLMRQREAREAWREALQDLGLEP